LALRNAATTAKTTITQARPQASKTVMREALGQLVAEGLIKKRRGAMGGSFVAKGNSERILNVVVDCYHLGGLTIEEVIDFRRNIEPIVLELACERPMRISLKFSSCCRQ